MEESGDHFQGQLLAEHRTIFVDGLSRDKNKEFLELYFENPKYGGGEIESISVDNRGGARIIFNDYQGFLLHSDFFLSYPALFVI